VYKYGVNDDRFFFTLNFSDAWFLGKKASRFSQPCRHAPEKTVGIPLQAQRIPAAFVGIADRRIWSCVAGGGFPY